LACIAASATEKMATNWFRVTGLYPVNRRILEYFHSDSVGGEKRGAAV